MKMKNILVFGAGVLSSLYAARLHDAGINVEILARGSRLREIQDKGVILVNFLDKEKTVHDVPVVSEIKPKNQYDLVIVIPRDNQVPSILPVLAGKDNLRNMLFLGNKGFERHKTAIDARKLLFGFGSSGGGRKDGVVTYADQAKPGGKRSKITIGEIDGTVSDRCLAIQSTFGKAGIPIEVSPDIDAWLKYHVALVGPIANGF
jgi:2-dehydropantoate 2-reductase